ncbi:peptidoglycan-binding protein [Streptomyces sp. NPDC058301]|uniref:peptidoglycan-binding protein n=1 Tax=Streptomyces sp. NPDC058301 TaxID=3346436 RepID=UPI0036E70FD6
MDPAGLGAVPGGMDPAGLGATGDPGATMPLHPIPPGARGTARQTPTDPHPPARGRRHPLLLTLAAAVTIATLGTAAYASGLLGGGDSEDRATAPATTVSTAPDPGTTSAAPPSPTTPEPTHSTPRTSPSPHKSAPSPTGTRKPSTAPSRRPTTPSPTRSQVTGTGTVDTTTAPAPPPATAPVLRRGDDGPEVAELQDRLAQLAIYDGKVDGHFGSRTENAVRTYQSYMGLEGDPPGVYGPETRRALEAQTGG